jgi:hypothetical protein
MPHDSPQIFALLREAHPLVLVLAEMLHERRGARVLEFGSGSGRNTRALHALGFDLVSIPDGEKPPRRSAPFAAAIATHALLHGRIVEITEHLDALADALETGGLFVATFASVRDARFGTGTPVEPFVFAPTEGDETGVPHAFFDRERLHEILAPRFEIETMDEYSVDRIAGRWAHRTTRLRGAVHWFVVARRRARVQ